MRVLINMTSAQPGTSGEVFTVEWLRAARELPSKHTFVAAFSANNQALAERLPPGVHTEVLSLPTSPALRTVAVQGQLRELIARLKVDVLLNRGNFYNRRPGCRQICMVENANAVSHPAIGWPASARVKHVLLAWLTRQALRHADHVVFPSENAAAGFLARQPTIVPWTAVPHGVAPGDTSLTRPTDAPERFVLAVTSMYPHKNLPRTVKGFFRLVTEHGYTGSLVMVGYGIADATLETLRALAPTPALAARLLVHAPMKPSALAPWYRAADLHVIPSLEETFGLPALEAMRYGCPCVVSDLDGKDPALPFFSPFREVCGDAAEYCDPFSDASIGDAMAAALRPARAAELREAGPVQAARFTWARTARSMEAILDAQSA